MLTDEERPAPTDRILRDPMACADRLGETGPDRPGSALAEPDHDTRSSLNPTMQSTAPSKTAPPTATNVTTVRDMGCNHIDRDVALRLSLAAGPCGTQTNPPNIANRDPNQKEGP